MIKQDEPTYRTERSKTALGKDELSPQSSELLSDRHFGDSLSKSQRVDLGKDGDDYNDFLFPEETKRAEETKVDGLKFATHEIRRSESYTLPSHEETKEF